MKIDQRIQTYVDPEILQKVKKMSEEKKLSMASTVRLIMIEYFTKKKTK